MRADELADATFKNEAEGIELVNRRIAQIQQLRGRLRQLGQAQMAHSTLSISDEMSLTMFRLYDAKFMLDQLMAQLRKLRDRRAKLMASARP